MLVLQGMGHEIPRCDIYIYILYMLSVIAIVEDQKILFRVEQLDEYFIYEA